MPPGSSSSSERLRIWLERGESGFWLRDAASGDAIKWDDPRLRVVIVQEAPRTAGFGAELAAILAEKAILDLRGPVLRVTGYDVPYPYWKIEDAYMPSVERVSDAVRRLLGF